MRAVFAPATALVGRLRYAQKFLAVGLVLMLPLGLVAQGYVDLQQDQIEFSATERIGVEMAVPLIELTAKVVQARHVAVDLAAHPPVDLAPELARLDELDARHGERLGFSREWRAVRRLLDEAQQADRPRLAFEQYSEVANELRALIVQVADRSNLSLDPQLDTDYLADVLVNQVPALLDVSGRMTDRTLLARRDLRVDRTIVLIELGLDNGVLSSTRVAMASGMRTALRSNDGPVLPVLAANGFDLVDREARSLKNQASGVTVSRRLQDLDREAAAPVQQAVLAFANEAAEELDRMLAARIGGFRAAERRVRAVSALSMLLAVYLFAGFYLSVSTPVRRMVKTLGAVADGDLGARVPIETRDELSVVGRALNDTVARTQQASERLAHRATHDELTGLASRALVLERLGDVPDRTAVVFCDVDGFKRINDSLGHEAGNEVLCTVAERLRQGVRPTDLLGRPAGDEFVVVRSGVEDPAEALALARDLLALIALPIPVRDGSARPRDAIVGASMGVAYAHGGSAEDLLRDADVAMYAAKQRGGGQVQVFDEQLRVAAQRRLEIEEALRHALQGGGLSVHYQPMVDVDVGRTLGVEALVRWQHPQLGMIEPAEFIPVAESTGLIVPLGTWILREACRQAAAWRRTGAAPADLHVAVNLSALQLADADLVPTVEQTLAETGLAPNALWLEITESTIMADAETAGRTLAELRRLGVHLALDDFGTGYSSLAYLRRFPVEVLKIDRSFVHGLGTDADSEAIIGMVTTLARTLGLQVVGEGVETAAQLADLRRLGCRAVQGYYFSRPLPPDEAWAAVLAEHVTAVAS